MHALLGAKWEKIAERERALEEQRRQVLVEAGGADIDFHKRMKINVGGHPIVTTRATLTQFRRPWTQQLRKLRCGMSLPTTPPR